MNILLPGTSQTITAIIRECNPVSHNNFIFEFMFPGGKVIYGGCSSVNYNDNDSPVKFNEVQSFTGYQFKEGEQVELNIYHFITAIDESILTALTTLELTPVADSSNSFKSAITTPYALAYRGVCYCTAETVYYPYNPIEGQFETIEKEPKNYKTR